MNKILILGSGELGHAIIEAIHQHPSFDPSTHSITTTVRPSTLASPTSPARSAQLSLYKTNNIAVLPLDVESATEDDLTKAFSPFTTIIHAGGMTLSPGTQTKVTNAALASSSPSGPKKTYIPWQFGLDYDVIGPEAGGGLFAEQVAIRKRLRSQTEVDWVIVSNGIFMSFLFEPVWGVVEVLDQPDPTDGTEIIARSLGSELDNLVVTTAEDIGKGVAELVIVDTELRGTPVFIAGQSIAYGEIADAIETVSGKKVRREVWTVPELKTKLEREPENKLRKYHVVFASAVGTDWDAEKTYDAKKGWKMTGVEAWLRDNFKTS